MHSILELKKIIENSPLNEGLNQTKIPCVKVFKASDNSEVLHSVYEPSLFIILQGSKVVMIGNKTFEYNNTSYLISSTYLTVSGKIRQATKKEPFLSIQIVFTLEEIFQAIEGFSLNLKRIDVTNFSASIYPLTENLIDVVLRLVKLLETPEDIEVLSKIYFKEILYRLLVTKQNIELLQLVFIESNAYKISKAISFMNKKLYETFLIEDIAKSVNMSESSFYKHFKTVTGISPLQYSKKIKLQEARRLMTLENMDITGAAFYVGYESTSQFSREYSSYFGTPPSRHIKYK